MCCESKAAPASADITCRVESNWLESTILFWLDDICALDAACWVDAYVDIEVNFINRCIIYVSFLVLLI